MSITISAWLFVVLMCLWIISALLSVFEKGLKIKNQKFAKKQLEFTAEELKQSKAKFSPTIHISSDSKLTAQEISKALSEIPDKIQY